MHDAKKMVQILIGKPMTPLVQRKQRVTYDPQIGDRKLIHQRTKKQSKIESSESLNKSEFNTMELENTMSNHQGHQGQMDQNGNLTLNHKIDELNTDLVDALD